MAVVAARDFDQIPPRSMSRASDELSPKAHFADSERTQVADTEDMMSAKFVIIFFFRLGGKPLIIIA
ncbi:hypothetical protein [Caballeronia grimmiae]|uniref:hypothetical protein n=1 Tax=Caballeronia grimmiae TaxID=1071679 RepID=UPI0038B8C531